MVTKEYLNIIKSRLEYFASKPITDLTDEEVQEFINLKKEFNEIFKDITEVVSKAYGQIQDMMNQAFEAIKETPEIKAQLKYYERVMNNDR